MTIILSTMGLLFMTPLGISVAVGTRVGNELGAGNPAAAEISAKVSLIVIIPLQTISALILLIIAPYWGQVW
jgi:MATE family multidrug resistance protein